MKVLFMTLMAVIGLFSAVPVLRAETVESKLAVLEKLPPQERQQRLLEGTKSEGEGVIYANMDVAAMKPLTDGFSRKYPGRSEEHTSELQSRGHLVCRLLPEKK